MHHLPRLRRRQEEIITALVGPHEGEAIGVAEHHAREDLQFPGGGIAAAAIAMKLSIADHRLEPAREDVLRFRILHGEGGGDLLEFLRPRRRIEEGENGGARRQPRCFQERIVHPRHPSRPLRGKAPLSES